MLNHDKSMSSLCRGIITGNCPRADFIGNCPRCAEELSLGIVLIVQGELSKLCRKSYPLELSPSRREINVGICPSLAGELSTEIVLALQGNYPWGIPLQ